MMIRICLLSVLALTAAHGALQERFERMSLGSPSLAQRAGYKKGKYLGKGKTGIVYAYTKGGNTFAVKQSLSKKTMADLWKESEMLTRLHDIGVKDVPTCYGRFRDDEFVEVVMGMAYGDNLAAIRKGSINLAEAKEILRSIASVAASIHANGIVHHDLHRENVKVYIDRKTRSVQTTTIDWAGYKNGLGKRKTDAKNFATLAGFTFTKAGATSHAEAAFAVMNNTAKSFDLLYEHSSVHMWRKAGEFWAPVYDDCQDMTGSGWKYVKGEQHYREDGVCYNIFARGPETRKVWVSARACRECGSRQ